MGEKIVLSHRDDDFTPKHILVGLGNYKGYSYYRKTKEYRVKTSYSAKDLEYEIDGSAKSQDLLNYISSLKKAGLRPLIWSAIMQMCLSFFTVFLLKEKPSLYPAVRYWFF